MGKKPQKKQ